MTSFSLQAPAFGFSIQVLVGIILLIVLLIMIKYGLSNTSEHAYVRLLTVRPGQRSTATPLTHGVGDSGNMKSEVNGSELNVDDKADDGDDDKGDESDNKTDDDKVDNRTMQNKRSRSAASLHKVTIFAADLLKAPRARRREKNTTTKGPRSAPM